jgi:hypothetical protein
MPDTESTIDLTDDEAFAQLVNRRNELYAIVQQVQEADRERKEIDAKILARLGNATSALTATDMITTTTIRRGSYVVPATVYRKLKILRRPKPKLKAV